MLASRRIIPANLAHHYTQPAGTRLLTPGINGGSRREEAKQCKYALFRLNRHCNDGLLMFIGPARVPILHVDHFVKSVLNLDLTELPHSRTH